MELPPIKLAVIIDGAVVDVLHTDDRLAAIFLSEPTIVEINQEGVKLGTQYDAETKAFIIPAPAAE